MGPIQTAANHPEYMLKRGEDGEGRAGERKRDIGAGRNSGLRWLRSEDRNRNRYGVGKGFSRYEEGKSKV